MNQAYFTDSNSPSVALMLEQLDYDPAKFPMARRDLVAIDALHPGETYVVQYSEEEDDDDAPTWGTITRLSDDKTVRALVRNGAVLGMAFDDAAARQDAMARGADSAEVATGEYVDGTLAALSGWGDILIGPESVGLAPDGRADRIDVGTTADENNGIGRRVTIMSEKKVPKPTWLNLYTLARCIEEAPDGVIGKVPPTDAPHLQRCINAGLLESAGARGTWKLSAAGIDALKVRS